MKKEEKEQYLGKLHKQREELFEEIVVLRKILLEKQKILEDSENAIMRAEAEIKVEEA